MGAQGRRRTFRRHAVIGSRCSWAREVMARMTRPSARLSAFAGETSVSDGPTKEDRRRVRKARRQARADAAQIEKEHAAALMAVFRTEISQVVRSTSPLLISLLANEGLTLDDAMALMKPGQLWPHEPQLRNRPRKPAIHAHMPKYYPVGLRPMQICKHPLHSHRFDRPGGDYLDINIVDHSLELSARIKPVFLQTRFGVLRVELDEVIPDTVLTGSIGRTIDEVVDHEAWRGRGWRIFATEDGHGPLQGQALVVAMGSEPYRVTWPEPDQK